MDYDLLIRNATVVDGTRAPRYEADIAVNNGRIVAPGFIDAHTHDDRLMLSSPDMTPKVSQGVTTVIAGNCGCSLAPAPNGMPRPVTPPLEPTRWWKCAGRSRSAMGSTSLT